MANGGEIDCEGKGKEEVLGQPWRIGETIVTFADRFHTITFVAARDGSVVYGSHRHPAGAAFPFNTCSLAPDSAVLRLVAVGRGRRRRRAHVLEP